MPVIEEILKLSKNGWDDALLNYVCDNYDEIECELNGKEYKEIKKHNRNFCIDCNIEMAIDYQKSTSVCTNCSLCEYYPVYVTSYSHTMQPLKMKCVYKRSDNFKIIVNQLSCNGKQFVPDNVVYTLWNGIHNRDNVLYNYTIPLTIPILECILKRNKMMKYKNGIYYIFFKLNSQPCPYTTVEERNLILNTFNVVSSIYDRYRPIGRKSFLNYYLF